MSALATEAAVEVVVDDIPAYDLRVIDRADCCRVQAFVVTEHKAGPLFWCGHHYHQYADKLPVPVVDNRHLINAKPDTPGDENEEVPS